MLEIAIDAFVKADEFDFGADPEAIVAYGQQDFGGKRCRPNVGVTENFEEDLAGVLVLDRALGAWPTAAL